MQSIRIAPWISWVDEAASLVLFDSRDASYHALNASASAIWRHLAAGRDEEEVVDAIVSEHGAPEAEAQEAVSVFVASALAKGLLVAE